MIVRVDNFSATAAISTVEFSLTHRKVFYGASTPMIFDSFAITYSGTIQNVPAGPIDFQLQVVDSENKILCGLDGTYIVPLRSAGALSIQLSNSNCNISLP